jgi:tripartite-type tricarboxylate transporter receptor subunit TctC
MPKRRLTNRQLAVAGVALALLAVSSTARTESVEEFYRGKQLRIIIRAAPGGNYDLYSRLLVRHLVRYIPGRPTAVPENMPGGSGLTALNYVAEVAPKDGTVVTMVTQTFPVEQALGLNRNLRVDLTRLSWLGNMSNSNTFLLTSRLSPTRTLADAKRRETVMAVPSTADVTAWLTALLNNTLGTRFRLVAGYPSGPAMNLAMERNEVEGRGTTNPRAMFNGGAAMAGGSGAAFNLLVQSGLSKDTDYPEVPLLRELAQNDGQRLVFDYVGKMGALARPLTLAAGVPPDRLAALRAAFNAATADPAFLAEANRQGMEIGAMSGEEVQQTVDDLVHASPHLLDEFRRAVQVNGVESNGKASAPE